MAIFGEGWARGPKPYLLAAILCGLLFSTVDVVKTKNDLVVRISDAKDLKQFLRTHTNVLIVCAKSERDIAHIREILSTVATEMKGQASILFIDCSDAKKLCKKMKLSTDAFELKHFQEGKFHKDYDRKLAVKSMINFLRDPKGEIPWEEDSTAGDVVHLETRADLAKFLAKDKRPTLVMFYAPWCGYCKRLKPDFAAAATELKGEAVLVGVDADRPENAFTKMEYNITGFPTLVYFENGAIKYRYGGENNREGIVKWMKNPGPPKEPAKEEEWSDTESDVVHLTDAGFDEYIAAEKSVLVMFYAPWCGHCKQMKPEYVKAAASLKEAGVDGTLAAVDATKHPKVSERFKVKGYPSVKYFRDGALAWDFSERTADKIVDFMKDPKEPPPPPPEEAAWEDTPSAVEHLSDETFKTFAKRKKHMLVMFYAPWCGHSKKAKPHFTNAAEKFKDDSKVAFAAIDCTKHNALCSANDVSGYPTFKYYNYGKNDQKYAGGREEDDFVAFMRDPLNPLSSAPAPTVPGKHWADIPNYENIQYLTSATFDTTLKRSPSALVMFYAPWCGHCNAMKADYVRAATALKADPNFAGVLAAVDATVEDGVAKRFSVKGYPTLKYFKDGVEAFDYDGARSLTALVDFMKNPVQKAKPAPQPRWADVDKNVLHLNADTFDLVTGDRGAVVMVMFYAPWCGHCTAAKPWYAEAAGRLNAPDSRRKMAAVDCVESPKLCETVGVKGFPTFKTYRDGQVVAESYSGARNADDVINFINSLPLAAPQADPKEEL